MTIKVGDGQVASSLSVNGEIRDTTGAFKDALEHGQRPYSGKWALKYSVGGLVVAVSGYVFTESLVVAIFVMFLVLSYCCYKLLARNKPNLILKYELDDATRESFGELVRSFGEISSVSRVWALEGHESVDDTKYSAGAGTTITRDRIRPSLGLPYYLLAEDLEVPNLGWLYFLPDRVLVGGEDEYAYGDLQVSATGYNFRERESVPSDARVVDKTWKYVNRRGGPDKRFKDNVEIPICEYGGLEVEVGDKRLHLMTSRRGPEREFGQALLDHRGRVTGTTRLGEAAMALSEALTRLQRAGARTGQEEAE